MAYTGTGTKSDPFVVTTFADFLACVAQEGVYVEVGADLDAAAEGYGYISPIDVKAVEVYGTAGDTLRKISNVTVEGNTLFEMRNGTGDQSLIRLHLENWTWKAASSPYVVSHAPIMFYRTNSNGYMHQCKVSVSVTANTATTACQTGYRFNFSDSAIVMEQHDGYWFPNSSSSVYESWVNTTVSVDGTGTVTWTGGSTGANRAIGCTNAGFVVKNMNVPSKKGGFGVNGQGFSYMVFEDCVIDGDVYAVRESNLICFAGTTDATGVTVSTGTVVTQAQLKDKAYLQQIGWLP